jgi:hypothetical protein
MENSMSETTQDPGTSTRQPRFWKLFLLGTGAAILGNLAGWVISLFLLMIVADDTVLEGYAWLTVLLSWNLVPLGCLVYGGLAGWQGPKIAQRRPTRLGRWVALWGFGLGVATWLVLGALTWVLVTFMA